MSNDKNKNPAVINLTAFTKLLGSAAVLSTENQEDYDAMISEAVKSLGPNDFVEQILVHEAVNATWDAYRYQRHKNLSSERRYNEYLFAEKKRREKEEERKRALAAQQREARELEQDPQRPGPGVQRLYELTEVIDAIPSEEDLAARPKDLDYSRFVEASLEHHERFDRLLNFALARRRTALEQLEWYRCGLGQQVRQITDKVIEGELSGPRSEDENEAPIAPADGGTVQ